MNEQRRLSPVNLGTQHMQSRSYLPTFGSVERVMRRFFSLTDISMNRLDTLIEAKGSYAWRWVNGLNRPRADSLLRVLEVANESIDGGDISKYGGINWENGEIRQMNKKSGLFEVIGTLPPEEGLDMEQSAPFDRPERVLARYLSLVNCSQGHLDRLLAAKMNYMWRWLHGQANPSSLYLLRMLEMANEILEGYPVGSYWKIQWDTGDIQFDKDAKDEGDDLPISQGTDVPPSLYQPRSTVARIPGRREERPGEALHSAQ